MTIQTAYNLDEDDLSQHIIKRRMQLNYIVVLEAHDFAQKEKKKKKLTYMATIISNITTLMSAGQSERFE